MEYKSSILLLSLYVILFAFGMDIILFYLTKDYYFAILCGIWIVFFIVCYVWFINLKKPPKTKKRGDN